MHVLTEVKEETESDKSRENSDIELSSDDNEEEIMTADDGYEGFALLHQDVLCSTQDKPSILRSQYS